MPQTESLAVQDSEDLESFWSVPDPWDYANTQDDKLRLAEIKSILPDRDYGRTLDIGCGNGFVTFELPGREVVGVDVSTNAVSWAHKAAIARHDSQRYRFLASSIFDLHGHELGQFDLIVLTGILYPQYIGAAMSVVREIIKEHMLPGSLLLSCHILQWTRAGFDLPKLNTVYYPYRSYDHQLSLYQR